jgi:hypothetical protein
MVAAAANAIALLTGDPLSERRFLVNLQQRSEHAGRPGLYAGFLGMLGAPKVDVDRLNTWLDQWETTTMVLSNVDAPPNFHVARIKYYRKAFNAILESDHPLNVLWPLLHTWTQAAISLPASDPGFQGWKAALNHLELLGAGFGERLVACDALLDQVEDTINTWEVE